MVWPFRARVPDYWAAIAPHADAVDLHASPQAFERQMERLPVPVGVLIAAHTLFTEVRTGGFARFFWEPAGVIAPDARQAFDELGLPRAAQQIAEAMRVVADPYPRVCEARRRIMDGIWDRTPETRMLRDGLAAHTRAFHSALGLGGRRRFVKAANRYAKRNLPPDADG